MSKEKAKAKNNPQENTTQSKVEDILSPDPKQEEKNNGEVNQQEDLEQELRSKDEEVDKIKNELEEIKDKYLRLYSEFENYKRRTARERIDLIKTANEDLMVALLPILDDFDRAKKSSENKEATAAALEGYELIYNKLIKGLEQKGLKNMGVLAGNDFNEEYHEAVAQMPSGDDLKGKIVDVIEQGYYLGDKVIRYAKVVIGI